MDERRFAISTLHASRGRGPAQPRPAVIFSSPVRSAPGFPPCRRKKRPAAGSRSSVGPLLIPDRRQAPQIPRRIVLIAPSPHFEGDVRDVSSAQKFLQSTFSSQLKILLDRPRGRSEPDLRPRAVPPEGPRCRKGDSHHLCLTPFGPLAANGGCHLFGSISFPSFPLRAGQRRDPILTPIARFIILHRLSGGGFQPWRRSSCWSLP